MPSARRRTGSRRWTGAPLVLSLGAIGALIGWTVATTMLPPVSSLYLDWIVAFAMLAAMVAGVVGGVFVGLLLLQGLRREVACPPMRNLQLEGGRNLSCMRAALHAAEGTPGRVSSRITKV